MAAHAYTMDDAVLDLDETSRGALARMAKGLRWVGVTGLTVTAATLLGMALAVVGAVGTLVVAVIALVCVAIGGALLAALLLVVAALCVGVSALGLAIGVAAVAFATVFTVGGWIARGVTGVFERFGSLRAQRALLLQPSKSSSA